MNYTILYLCNPDVVSYDTLDSAIVKTFKQLGHTVIQATLQSISFDITKESHKLLIQGKQTQIHGFFAYGAMSPANNSIFLHIVKVIENMGVTLLHNYQTQRLLSSKYLQSLYFAKRRLPIPNTYQGFSVQSFKDITNRQFKDQMIIKRVGQYGSDFIYLGHSKNYIVNIAAKNLWQGQQCIMQDFVKESNGKSIRVICINGKAVSVGEYVQKKSFISNISFDGTLQSRMQSTFKKQYQEMAERAVKDMNVAIAGVDLLQSKEKGLLILQVNKYPEIEQNEQVTGVCLVRLLCQEFLRKITKRTQPPGQTLKQQIKRVEGPIIYMTNPNKVYFNQLDDYLINSMKQQGQQVIKVNLQKINFRITSEGTQCFIGNDLVRPSGFLAYGYMSPSNWSIYSNIVSAFQSMDAMCLNEVEVEQFLNNKLFQVSIFSKHGLNIPQTFYGCSIKAYYSLMNAYPKNQVVMKTLSDYGGDGVSKFQDKRSLVDTAAKVFWKNRHLIFQQFINDSPGQSIRVLCFQGKAFAVAKYINKTGNFISNCQYGDLFSLQNLDTHPKLAQIKRLGQQVVKAVGCYTLGGVDILDSKERGLVVLQVNGFPDIFDIDHCSKLNIFKKFGQVIAKKAKGKY